MIAFSIVGFVSLYALQRLQNVLPLNPQGFDAVPSDLAFNTSISFITNTNWQNYGGETTMSHLTQMLGLTVHNFLSAATGLAMAFALVRAFARSSATTVGNFWVDMTRIVLYVLLPISIVVALVFVALGVPQTLTGSVDVTTLEGAKQTISIGPMASQEAIKELGTNGGGFMNANSAHPFENPNAWTNMLRDLGAAADPGRFRHRLRPRRRRHPAGPRDPGRRWRFCSSSASASSTGRRAPAIRSLTALGVDPAAGNLEGKEVRFGQAMSALFATATTGTGTGAVNHDARFADAARRPRADVQPAGRLHLAGRRRRGALRLPRRRGHRRVHRRADGRAHARISRQEDRIARDEARDVRGADLSAGRCSASPPPR